MQLESWLREPTPASSNGPFTHSRAIYGLSGLDKALVIAQALKANPTQSIWVLSHQSHDARDLIDHLQFFLGAAFKDRIHYLPPYPFDFFRGLLPNPELIAERNVFLHYALQSPKGRIFVTTPPSILQKVPKPDFFRSRSLEIKEEGEIAREDLILKLSRMGYQRQPTTFDKGNFSVRGGVIDLFSPQEERPIRLEYFGDWVEEMRYFDPKGQLSQERVASTAVLPVALALPPEPAEFERVSLALKERFDEMGVLKGDREDLIEKVKLGETAADFALLFPLINDGSSSLFDYCGEEPIHLFWDLPEAIKEQLNETEIPKLKKSYEAFEKEGVPIAPFDSLFLEGPELEKNLKERNPITFVDFDSGKAGLTLSTFPCTFNPGESKAGLIENLRRQVGEWQDKGYTIHIVCHTHTHADSITALMEPHHVRTAWRGEAGAALPALFESKFDTLQLWQGYLAESRVYPDLRMVLLSEELIFGKKKRVQASTKAISQKETAQLLAAFRELNVNDYIVHKEFGIGKYLGLKRMNFLDIENDYVLLEYKDGDKLYIPVYRLNILQKYVGGDASPVLDKLGTDRWIKAKGKAQRAVAELAEELIRIHSQRKLIPAFAFAMPGEDYREFEMSFPYDETPDQMKAIIETMEDLSKPNPMDRLICGDVGYGKTEVAMRAAFRAIIEKKQVAVLVPTTVLALQHYENFSKRFKQTGARIEMVSRVRSTAQVKKTLTDTLEGKVDILIGTHRLLSSDIQFKDLALLIVDEEHRFGVVHKERLKKMSSQVHVLTLTATPIPRTLNMAMAGIKEISIMTTPPPDRLSVRTFVCRFHPEVITEAISNEIGRGGQVFFVHNRIETIFKLADQLKEWLPKLRVEVVHGQMDGETLEKRMLKFYQGECDLLLTTTLIESGLDIPRANTMIIDQAHHLGLAQLYQLKGRVGRSEKRAYCYLLIPAEGQITDDGKQRLQVIQRYTELGSGFSIASHDLEIRGAGDLLGKSQSGHVNAVGVDLYFELLEESLQLLKGQKKKVQIEPEISIPIQALFPENYLPDVTERIQLYRRLSSCEMEEGISDLESEIRDRFGELPEPVTNLLGLMRIRIYLKKLHVLRMGCGPKKTSLQFAATTPARVERLVELIQKDPDDRYAMTPDNKLVIEVKEHTWQGQLREIQALCDYLKVD